MSGDLGAIVTGFAPVTSTFCVDDGCYSVNMFDSFGDGWNGATWTITDGTGVVVDTGTLASGGSGTAVVQLGDADCEVPVPVTASDCHEAINVCTNIDFYIDPNGAGNVLEIPASGSTSNPYYDGFTTFNPWGTTNTGCLLNDELNSTWMIVNIAEGGWLEFVFGGLGTQSGYYDWAMWTYDENTCSNILNDLQAPVRCNWNGAASGGTGLVTTIPAGGSATNYEPPLWTVTGDQFIICFSNWSSVTNNVPLEFGGTAVVSCEPIMLPVELVELNATAMHDGVLVDWSTVSEQDNAAFVVQRSQDGLEWMDVAWAEGAGTSFEVNRYEYFDEEVQKGTYYYRLKQIDVNGNMRFTHAVSVEFQVDAKLTLMPNPLMPGNSLHLSFSNLQEGMTCSIVGIEGREYFTFDPNSWTDEDKLEFEVSGIFVVRLLDEGQAVVDSKRLVVHQ